MATFTFITTFNEVEVDNDNNSVVDYTSDLPHHDLISAAAEKSWNEMHMEQFYDGILTDKVESAVMKCRKNINRETKATISVKMKPGSRLTEKYRNALIDQTSAQLIDGWGESFFGYINIMTDNNGKRFYVI